MAGAPGPRGREDTVTMSADRDLNAVRFLTVAEVASMMRVSKMTVYRLVHSGELPAVRVGERSIRVDRREVERFLKENRRVIGSESGLGAF